MSHFSRTLFAAGAITAALAGPGRAQTAVTIGLPGIPPVFVTTQAYVAEQSKRQKLLVAMGEVRRRVLPLTLQELRDVTDVWVDSVMDLAPINLRKMEMLALAQDRLFGQTSSARFG